MAKRCLEQQLWMAWTAPVSTPSPNDNFGVNILNKPSLTQGGGKEKEKKRGKKKSVMDGHIIVTISVVHQNQWEVLALTAIPVKRQPHKTEQSPRANGRDPNAESSPESRDTLSYFKHLVLYSSSDHMVRTWEPSEEYHYLLFPWLDPADSTYCS